MALLLESWELPVLFRWTFVKQDYRIKEILELKSTTETCKSKFSHLTTVSLQTAVLAATEDGSWSESRAHNGLQSELFTIWHGKKNIFIRRTFSSNVISGMNAN